MVVVVVVVGVDAVAVAVAVTAAAAAAARLLFLVSIGRFRILGKEFFDRLLAVFDKNLL